MANSLLVNPIMQIAKAAGDGDMGGIVDVLRGMIAQLHEAAAASPEAQAGLAEIIAESEAKLAEMEKIADLHSSGDYAASSALAQQIFPLPDYYEGFPKDAKALREAISDGDLEEVRRILPLVPLNQGYGSHESVPLGWALQAATKRLELVQIFLDAGADPTYATTDGYTALHWAVDSGYCEDAAPTKAIALLIAHGADIEAVTHWGWTPLQQAVMRGSPDELAALLTAGANPNRLYTDQSMPEFTRGLLPLMQAATDPEKLQLLLDHGADIAAHGADGRSVIEYLRDQIATYGAELARDVAAGEDEDFSHSFVQSLQTGLETIETWAARPQH